MISGLLTESEPKQDILEVAGALEDGWELHSRVSGHILTK